MLAGCLGFVGVASGWASLGLGFARLAGLAFWWLACCLAGSLSWLSWLALASGSCLLCCLACPPVGALWVPFAFARLPFPFGPVWSLGCGLFCFPSLVPSCPCLPSCLPARLVVLRRVAPWFVCPRGGFPGLRARVRSFLCFPVLPCCLLGGLLCRWACVGCVLGSSFPLFFCLLVLARPPCSSPVRARLASARAHAIGVFVFDQEDKQHLPSIIAPAGLPV